jgi:hypothetical protein
MYELYCVVQTKNQRHIMFFSNLLHQQPSPSEIGRKLTCHQNEY